jgi:predicted RNase H-like HicB family nuclease
MNGDGNMKQHLIIDGEVFTADIWKEEEFYIAQCSELDILSQGKTIKTARDHLKEAARLFLTQQHGTEE